MNTMFFVIIVAVVLVIIGGAVGVSNYLARKRREEFAKVAEQLGLSYHPADAADLLSQFGIFQLFNQGRGRGVSNVIVAEADGIHLSIFDYQFTTGSGKHQHTHRQSIVAVHSQQLRLPSI